MNYFEHRFLLLTIASLVKLSIVSNECEPLCFGWSRCLRLVDWMKVRIFNLVGMSLHHPDVGLSCQLCCLSIGLPCLSAVLLRWKRLSLNLSGNCDSCSLLTTLWLINLSWLQIEDPVTGTCGKTFFPSQQIEILLFLLLLPVKQFFCITTSNCEIFLVFFLSLFVIRAFIFYSLSFFLFRLSFLLFKISYGGMSLLLLLGNSLSKALIDSSLLISLHYGNSM
jgi:hypothetical protein